jgi:hypothetical protein
MSRLSREYGNLDVSKPYGLPGPVTGTALLFFLIHVFELEHDEYLESCIRFKLYSIRIPNIDEFVLCSGLILVVYVSRNMNYFLHDLCDNLHHTKLWKTAVRFAKYFSHLKVEINIRQMKTWL